MTVAVIGTIRFPAENVAHVLPHMKALVDATNAHDGCLAYDVGQDPFDPGLFRFSELWPDQASLTAHLTAPHIQPWREVGQKYGVSDRRFQVFDVTNARSL